MTAPEVVSDQRLTESQDSTDLNARAAARAERRMLIDGQLVESTTGETFGNVSPATGAVLGVTTAAGIFDMDWAITAARRAFDETDWSPYGSARPPTRPTHRAICAGPPNSDGSPCWCLTNSVAGTCPATDLSMPHCLPRRAGPMFDPDRSCR